MGSTSGDVMNKFWVIGYRLLSKCAPVINSVSVVFGDLELPDNIVDDFNIMSEVF